MWPAYGPEPVDSDRISIYASKTSHVVGIENRPTKEQLKVTEQC